MRLPASLRSIPGRRPSMPLLVSLAVLGLFAAIMPARASDAPADPDAARVEALQQRIGAKDALEEPLSPFGAELWRRNDPIPRDIEIDAPTRGCNGDHGLGLPKGCNGVSLPSCNPNSLPQGDIQPPSAMAVRVLVGVLIGLLVIMIARILWARRATIVDNEAEEHALIVEARALSVDAVDVALARNDYNAAIHALFLRNLLHLSRSGRHLHANWTPREIAQRIDLPRDAGASLRTLVYLAELAAFADHRSSEEEFRQAQAADHAIRAAVPASHRTDEEAP